MAIMSSSSFLLLLQRWHPPRQCAALPGRVSGLRRLKARLRLACLIGRSGFSFAHLSAHCASDQVDIAGSSVFFAGTRESERPEVQNAQVSYHVSKLIAQSGFALDDSKRSARHTSAPMVTPKRFG